MHLIIIYYIYYLNHLFPDLKGTVHVPCYPPHPPLFKEGKHMTVVKKTDKLVTV